MLKNKYGYILYPEIWIQQITQLIKLFIYIYIYVLKYELILTALRLFKKIIFNFKNLSISINHKRLEGSHK